MDKEALVKLRQELDVAIEVETPDACSAGGKPHQGTGASGQSGPIDLQEKTN
jgi:hypothetical protein